MQTGRHRNASGVTGLGLFFKKSMKFWCGSVLFLLFCRLLQSEPGCEEGMDTLLLSGVDQKQREILDRNPEAIFGT